MEEYRQPRLPELLPLDYTAARQPTVFSGENIFAPINYRQQDRQKNYALEFAAEFSSTCLAHLSTTIAFWHRQHHVIATATIPKKCRDIKSHSRSTGVNTA
jgi:hypothetical protein